MGGCASKPKGLKAEVGEAPAPVPEPVKEEEAGTGSEAKEETEKKVEGEDDGEKVDEQGNKRRSLSLLFKENEEGKDSTEDDKMPLEPTKATGESEIKAPEAEKSEIIVEQTAAPDVVDAPKTEEVVEASPALETQKPEPSEEKKPEEEEEKKGSVAENVKV